MCQSLLTDRIFHRYAEQREEPHNRSAGYIEYHVCDARTLERSFASLRMTTSQRISTSAIIACCRDLRSDSNSSGVAVVLTRCGSPISTRTFAKGRGTMNRSQLPRRQQREYSKFIGKTGVPDFWARNIMPGPSSYAGPRGPSGVITTS